MVAAWLSHVGCLSFLLITVSAAMSQECVFVAGRSLVPDEVFQEPAIMRKLATDGRYIAFTVPLISDGESYTDGRVFYYDTHGDRSLQRLQVPPGQNLQFGSDISIVDGIAYVGARGESVWGNPAIGFVYVYDLSNGEQIGHVAPPAFVSWGFFGTRIWVHGDQLFVRSSGVTTTEPVTGTVYMYNRHTYEYIAEVAPDYLYNGGFYGASHAVNLRCVAISEPGRRDQAGWERGAVFLFDPVTGDLLREFHANDRDNTMGFGGKIAMTDRYLAAYCRRMSFRGRFDHGVVQIFDLDTGDFLYELRHPSVVNDWFGSSLTSMGDWLIVGDPVVYGIDGGFRIYRFGDGEALQTVIRPFDMSLQHYGFGQVLCTEGESLFVREPHPSLAGVAASAAEFTTRSMLLDRAAPFGQIDISDLMAFVSGFVAGDRSVDIAEPYERIDFFDLARYVSLYSGGCD
jgi:hypothetical protein